MIPAVPPAKRKPIVSNSGCAGETVRQFTRSDHDKFGLLIVMGRTNLQNMYRIHGGGFGGETRLLIYYTGHPGDAAGLWYTDDFETAWRDVLEVCINLLGCLKSEGTVC